MQTLKHLTGSLDAVSVFESAGRLLSFTAAGRELGLTQAAVSYAIRGLERQLGAPLFQRAHKRVALTEIGQRFLTDVTLGLSVIRRSAEDVKAFASNSHVTLAASSAFAAFWMMPRLQRFRDELPGVDLRIQTSDRDLDIKAEGIQLAIRGGRPDAWPDYEAVRLADEAIDAIAGASYVKEHGRPRRVADLLNHRFIHLEEPHREAATWRDWLASGGLERQAAPRGLIMNDYALVVQAAMEGQGIALGWRHLTENLIRAGLLVRLTDHTLRTGSAFYVVRNKDSALTDRVRQVRDWLIAASS
jgi:DNA-binding transcriptional LysR family regulator